MTTAEILPLLPLAVLGAAAVLTMLLAPLAADPLVRSAALAGLVAGAATAVAVTGHGRETTLYAADRLATFGTVFACLCTAAALLAMPGDYRSRAAPTLFVLVALGASAIAGGHHAAILLLGLELVSLPLVALVAFPLTRLAVEAGYKIFILSAGGTATVALGIALAYAASGSAAFAAWPGDGMVATAAGVLILAGLALKLGLVPLHMWVPDVFDGAPAGAAALVGTVSKGAVVFALMRLLSEGALGAAGATGLATVGVASVVLGNVAALRQRSLFRMLGYSGVAHSGFIALILAAGADAAAALFYLAAYALTLLLAFAVAAGLPARVQLEDLSGLLGRSPLAGGGFVIAMVSLAGLPVTAGFFAKAFLFVSLLDRPLLLAVALAGTAIGIVYYTRFVIAASRSGQSPYVAAAHMRVLVAVLALAVVALGIQPAPLRDAVVWATSNTDRHPDGISGPNERIVRLGS